MIKTIAAHYLKAIQQKRGTKLKKDIKESIAVDVDHHKIISVIFRSIYYN